MVLFPVSGMGLGTSDESPDGEETTGTNEDGLFLVMCVNSSPVSEGDDGEAGRAICLASGVDLNGRSRDDKREGVEEVLGPSSGNELVGEVSESR
jgi:hypothetical protein